MKPFASSIFSKILWILDRFSFPKVTITNQQMKMTYTQINRSAEN